MSDHNRLDATADAPDAVLKSLLARMSPQVRGAFAAALQGHGWPQAAPLLVSVAVSQHREQAVNGSKGKFAGLPEG